MKRQRRVLTVRAVAMVAAVLLGACTTLAASGTELAFRSLDRGDYAAIEDAGCLVVRSESEFADLWHRIHQTVSAEPPLPDVDFSRQLVLAAFQGQQPSGGHAISIDRVVEQGDRLTVVVSESVPAADAMVTMALTSPYHLVAVDLADGRAAFVRVEFRGCR